MSDVKIPDDMGQQLQRVASGLLEQHCDRFVEDNFDACQSPIEMMMLFGLNLEAHRVAVFFDEIDLRCAPGRTFEDLRAELEASDAKRLVLAPQMKVGKYRADFVLLFSVGGAYEGIVIECDGHDYHYSDKATVAKDRRRDREMQALGFRVLRFPGNEIVTRLEDCVDEVYAVVFEKIFGAYCARAAGKRPTGMFPHKSKAEVAA